MCMHSICVYIAYVHIHIYIYIHIHIHMYIHAQIPSRADLGEAPHGLRAYIIVYYIVVCYVRV